MDVMEKCLVQIWFCLAGTGVMSNKFDLSVPADQVK